MIVRMLDIRLMILPLTLVSGPAPKEGSWDAGDRPTRLGDRVSGRLSRIGRGNGAMLVRTAREEAILGEDGDGVDEEDVD